MWHWWSYWIFLIVRKNVIRLQQHIVWLPISTCDLLPALTSNSMCDVLPAVMCACKYSTKPVCYWLSFKLHGCCSIKECLLAVRRWRMWQRWCSWHWVIWCSSGKVGGWIHRGGNICPWCPSVITPSSWASPQRE